MSIENIFRKGKNIQSGDIIVFARYNYLSELECYFSSNRYLSFAEDNKYIVINFTKINNMEYKLRCFNEKYKKTNVYYIDSLKFESYIKHETLIENAIHAGYDFYIFIYDDVLKNINKLIMKEKEEKEEREDKKKSNNFCCFN